MRRLRSLNPIHAPARRPLAVVCLVAYLLTWLGVPLPVMAAPAPQPTAEEREGEAAAEPFPCQDCHCHCSSAEQCWQGCCCFNMQERIEWSRANNVEPPTWVLALPEYRRALAELEGNAKYQTPAPQAMSCCSQCPTGVASCPPGSVPRTTNRSLSAIEPAASASPAENSAEDQTEKSTTRWLVLFEAQACMGLSLHWVVSGAAMPTPPPVCVQPDVASQPLVLNTATLATPVSHAPPIPPPRPHVL